MVLWGSYYWRNGSSSPSAGLVVVQQLPSPEVCDADLDGARLRYQATSQRQLGLRLRSNLRDLQVPLVPTLR